MEFKFAVVAFQCSRLVVRRDFTKYKDTSKPKVNYNLSQSQLII